MSPILSVLPFASYVVPSLFPIWMLILSFRRSITLSLVIGVMGMATSAFSFGLISFILTASLFLCFFPGQIVGIWVFKKLVDKSIPLALFLYRFLLIVVGGIIAGIITLIILLFGLQFLQEQTSSITLPFDISKLTVSTSFLKIVGAIGSLGLIGFMIGVPAFLLITFILECRFLNSVNKRVKGLPTILK